MMYNKGSSYKYNFDGYSNILWLPFSQRKECKVALCQICGCDSFTSIFVCALQQYQMGLLLTDHEEIPFDNMGTKPFPLEYF